jgi:DNA-binding transcriptional LysR family regulator
VRSGEVDIALIDDWYGGVRPRHDEMLRVYPLLRDPIVLAVPRRHRVADPSVPVDLWALRDEPWMATPDGEPSRMAVDRLLSEVGGAQPVPWEFEGLGTIISLVAKGIGIAAVPALALAAGVRGVAVREFPGDPLTREVKAVVRSSSVNRPSVAATLRALHVAARYLAAELAPVRYTPASTDESDHDGVVRPRAGDPAAPARGTQQSTSSGC